MNKKQFKSPSVDAGALAKATKAARDLKAKVSGTSFVNSSPDATKPGNLAFQTNTSIVHTSLGEINPIDKAFKDE